MVLAAQMVFANVEAHESPHHTRGFQDWLGSPELDESLRTEVARQLADFSPPSEIDLGSEAGQQLQRHAFYRVEALDHPWWVLARTVPVKDRDMYGRYGLFLAHAFVLTDEAFATIGYNPFALLDADPPFISSRAQAKERAPDWSQGVINPIELPVSLGGTPSPGVLSPAVLVALTRYLEEPTAAPLVIAEAPHEMLNLLRPLFAWLPPQLRGRLGFDTLFSGQSLAGSPFRVVGAYSAESLSTWTDQRVHRWYRDDATFSPPLPEPDSAFARQLQRWLEAGAAPTPAKVAAVYDLLVAITSERLAEVVPHGLEEADLVELMEDQALKQQTGALRTVRVNQDLPIRPLQRLIRDPLVEYFRVETWTEQLRRIATPIEHVTIASWLRQRLENLDLAPPSEIELAALVKWLGTETGEDFARCRLMVQRWRNRADWLHENIGEAGSWFWPWCRRTLELRHGEGDSLSSNLLNVLRGPSCSEEQLADAALWIDLTANDVLTEEAAHELMEMQFQLAFHRQDIEALRGLLGDERNKSLMLQAFKRLDSLPRVVDFCCLYYDGDYHVGLRIEFTGANAATAGTLASAQLEGQGYRAIEYWRNVAMQGVPPPIEGRTIRQDPHRHFDECRRQSNWRGITVYLKSRACNDSMFVACVESALELRVIEQLFVPIAPNLIWCGLRVKWAIPDQARRLNALFGAILDSVAPVHELKSWYDIASIHMQPQVDRPRLGWLMLVLLQQRLVGQLSIAR